MNKLLIFCIILLWQGSVHAQPNCGNPFAVDICPSVHLINQTNAGMLDDAPTSCNVSGEDLVYEIYAPQGALHIFVSLINSTGPSKLTLNSGNCSDTICNSYNAPAGNSNFSFTVSTSNYYYLWIDASVTIEFDISIGGDTAIQSVNIPNTQGLLSFDNCATNPFKTANPFFEVQFNNVFETNPMTLAPLNAFGQMCVSVYLKNTSGVSGAEIFQFTFNPAGFDSITPVDTLFPGFYNSGFWRSSSSGVTWQFNFSDSLGLNRGDFTGIPNTCLKYKFCFDLIPKTNDPSLTNVLVNIYNDSYGAGFVGTVGLGCCPSNYSNCLNQIGTGSGSQSGLSFDFDDPGGSLPIELTSFNAKIISEQVLLSWITTTEINNDYFTLEKSQDGEYWISFAKIDGAGNSSMNKIYSSRDLNPFQGISYYRLRQTDFDGRTTVSDPIKLEFNRKNIMVYPNPTSNRLYVKLPGHNLFKLTLHNLLGEEVKCRYETEDSYLNVDDLPKGMYILSISLDGELIQNDKIIIQAQ